MYNIIIYIYSLKMSVWVLKFNYINNESNPNNYIQYLIG